MHKHLMPAVLAAAGLALAGCSDAGGGSNPKPTVTVTASPSMSKTEARQACVDAWLDVMTAPDYDPERGLDDRPAVCEGLPGQADMYADALMERNARNRERLQDCVDDPACTEFPIP